MAAPHVKVEARALARRTGIHDRVNAVVAHVVRADVDDAADGRDRGSEAAMPFQAPTPEAVVVPLAVGRGRELEARARRRWIAPGSNTR